MMVVSVFCKKEAVHIQQIRHKTIMSYKYSRFNQPMIRLLGNVDTIARKVIHHSSVNPWVKPSPNVNRYASQIQIALR